MFKRRGKKIVTLCCVFINLLALSGCQLAREEEAGGQDMLCGILVTTQEQEDAYREAHGEIRTEPESVTLTEREFRQITEGEAPQVLLDGAQTRVEGVWQENGDLVFEGLEGASLLAGYREQDEAGEYLHFTSTGAMTDIKADSRVTDTGEYNSMEGTVTICQSADVTICMNRVYQRADGSVYVLLEGGAGYWNSGQTSPGGVFSKSYKEERGKTLEGKETSAGQEFTVRVAVDVDTTAVTIKEWDAGDIFLGVSQVKRGQERFILHEATEYFMVEETKSDGNVKRGVYTWDQEEAQEGMLYHTVLYEDGYGLLEPVTLTFEKP